MPETPAPKTTDLVAQLRATACTAGCNSSPRCLCDLNEMAADEIERLRAALRKIAAIHPERIGYHGDIAQAALEPRK